jgi:Tetratricopeptide repeat
MKKLSRLALTAAVAVVLGSAAVALADSPPPPKGQVSNAAAKDLQAAQKAIQQDKNYDAGIASLDKVKANTHTNEYDQYVMDVLYFGAYAGQKKYDEAEPYLELMIASKYLPPDELKQRLYQAAALSYEKKDYDKAIDFGKRAIEHGDTTEETQSLVGQAYYLKDDFKNTDSFVRTAVDQQIKAGQTPSEDFLKLGLSAEVKLKDEPGEIHWLELMVSYHPSPEYWEDLLDPVYRNKLTDRQTLQLYRLSADVGTLKQGSEYSEMAQLALDAGSPGEAQAILTKAFANNVFADAAAKARNQHLLDSAKKLAAVDQPTLPKMEAEAANAPSGDRMVGAGTGYFSYGDYAKAATDIAAGLAKGNTKDPADARLLLGISQLRSGDKDAAVKTFKAVTGDPVDERLAALWILHAKT